MDTFLDWYLTNIDNHCVDAKVYRDELKFTGTFPMLDTMILFKKNNELYRENIQVIYDVYAKQWEDDCNINKIDINPLIEANKISYDEFVEKYSREFGPNSFGAFLINNLEYKASDIKIALKD
jgi:hypothetical protein